MSAMPGVGFSITKHIVAILLQVSMPDGFWQISIIAWPGLACTGVSHDPHFFLYKRRIGCFIIVPS